jgi:hypothetical protein
MDGSAMREEDALNPVERETLAALARFGPAGARLDISLIRSEAGRRQGARQLWRWRGIAAALAAGLILSWIWRSRPPIVERVIYVRDVQPVHIPSPQPAASVPHVDPTAESTRPGDDYFALRSRVLAYGVGVLRPATGSGRNGLAQPVPTAAPVTGYDLENDRGSL